MKSTPLFSLTTSLAMLACSAGLAHADNDRSKSAAPLAVVNAVGSVMQLTYNDDGVAAGLLVGNNTLLAFPERVCGGVASLGSVGQVLTYSGTAKANAGSGVQTVKVTALLNNVSGAAFTAPAANTPATPYPATAGSISLLNYSDSGDVNGFVFTPNGSATAVLASLGGKANALLKPLLAVGATASVTGSTRPGSACNAAAMTVVRTTTLTVNGRTFFFSGRDD